MKWPDGAALVFREPPHLLVSRRLGRQLVARLHQCLHDDVVGFGGTDRDEHVFDAGAVIKGGDVLPELRVAVDVRIIDLRRQQGRELVLVVAEQLIQPDRMDAGLRQVDIDLLFPDGLRVFEVERRKFHELFLRLHRPVIISQGRPGSSKDHYRGKFVLQKTNLRFIVP